MSFFSVKINALNTLFHKIKKAPGLPDAFKNKFFYLIVYLFF